jgi:hypothetical protein
MDDGFRAASEMTNPSEMAFVITAIVTATSMPEIEAAGSLVATEGRDRLQYMDAFRLVDDKLGALKSHVGFTLRSRRTVLAVQALQVYASPAASRATSATRRSLHTWRI